MENKVEAKGWFGQKVEPAKADDVKHGWFGHKDEPAKVVATPEVAKQIHDAKVDAKYTEKGFMDHAKAAEAEHKYFEGMKKKALEAKKKADAAPHDHKLAEEAKVATHKAEAAWKKANEFSKKAEVARTGKVVAVKEVLPISSPFSQPLNSGFGFGPSQVTPETAHQPTQFNQYGLHVSQSGQPLGEVPGDPRKYGFQGHGADFGEWLQKCKKFDQMMSDIKVNTANAFKANAKAVKAAHDVKVHDKAHDTKAHDTKAHDVKVHDVKVHAKAHDVKVKDAKAHDVHDAKVKDAKK